jgi:hypothetical protein
MRWRIHVCVIAATVLAPAASSYAGTLTLKAQAGLGGLGRTGRWAPVRVSVENTDRDVTGDLVVSWGDAVVRRAMSLGSPARADLVVYIRSGDVRDVVSVRVESHGAVLQSTDASIRLQSPEEDVTLCVGSSDTSAANDACDATVSAAALPRAMWGYDAIDHLHWEGTSPDALDRDQRIALEQWTAKRLLDDAGVVPSPPRPLPPDDESGGQPLRLIALGTVVYLVLLIAATSAARHVRRRPLVVLGVIGAFAVVGSAAALAAGRVGPSTAVVVTHSSRVDQLPSGGSLVAMKASAQYPTYDAFELRGRLTDGSIVPRNGSRAEARLDEAGEPMLPGAFGFAARQPFALEGVIAFSPFRLSRKDGAVIVANSSAFDYQDCYFSDGVSRQAAGSLRAGQTVDAPAVSSAGNFISCRLAATPVDFEDSRHPVRVEGSTDVVAYLDPLTRRGGR